MYGLPTDPSSMFASDPTTMMLMKLLGGGAKQGPLAAFGGPIGLGVGAVSGGLQALQSNQAEKAEDERRKKEMELQKRALNQNQFNQNSQHWLALAEYFNRLAGSARPGGGY